MRTISRFCLDRQINGQPCHQRVYRLINDTQAAYYVTPINEGNHVESEGTQTVPPRPRASSTELLENRLKTVRNDPSNILNKRMKFTGRQIQILGNLKF